jgi:hypothetical protein
MDEPEQLLIDGLLDLHTFRPQDVCDLVPAYLAECRTRGLPQVRVIHGKGIVQCKRWRERQVGVTVVRELYGVMVADGAVRGIIVSSGTFTPDAVAFAAGKSLTLVDGPALEALVAPNNSMAALS